MLLCLLVALLLVCNFAVLLFHWPSNNWHLDLDRLRQMAKFMCNKNSVWIIKEEHASANIQTF